MINSNIYMLLHNLLGKINVDISEELTLVNNIENLFDSANFYV